MHWGSVRVNATAMKSAALDCIVLMTKKAALFLDALVCARKEAMGTMTTVRRITSKAMSKAHFCFSTETVKL